MKTGIGSLPKTNGVGQASKPWTVLRVMLQSADYLADKGVESARLVRTGESQCSLHHLHG